MALDSTQRHALAAQANRLVCRMALDGDALDEAAIEHVRRALARGGLLKVRVRSVARDQRRSAGAALCAALGCELVQIVGQVLTLYRAPSEPQAPPQP